MSVYVDQLMYHGWKFQGRWTRSCHMFADSLDELVEFALKIGMKQKWLQHNHFPHFDLTESRRIFAINEGAIELSRKEAVEKWEELKKVFSPSNCF